MSQTPVDFSQEFPEYKDHVHQLKLQDAHFARIFSEYQDCSAQLHRIAQEIETPSDDVVEQLKKQRLHLKDQLVAIIRQKAA